MTPSREDLNFSTGKENAFDVILEPTLPRMNLKISASLTAGNSTTVDE
jgi:hypothetical protein